MTKWSFGAASVRGTSHIKNGTRIQDAKRCFELKLKSGASVFCAVVSDGAGSASHGGEGAIVVCRSFGEFLRQHFLSQTGEFPTEDLLWDWLDETRDRIFLAATNRSLKPRDFAATLIVAVTNGHQTLTAHIGDGVIVARTSEDQKWQVFSPSENGEYASTTFFVTDTGTPRFRIATWNTEIDAVFVFSDGIENQVMDLVVQIISSLG